MGRQATQKRIVLTFDANIGAGKTKLINVLGAQLNALGIKCKTLCEPVDEWISSGILGKYYENPKKYAIAFQTHVVASRVERDMRTMEKDDGTQVFLIERSFAGDEAFARTQHEIGNMDDIEWHAYESFIATWHKIAPFPDTNTPEWIVRSYFINTSVDQCVENIHKRSREGENTIKRDYLTALDKAHHDIADSTIYGKLWITLPWCADYWKSTASRIANEIQQDLSVPQSNYTNWRRAFGSLINLCDVPN